MREILKDASFSQLMAAASAKMGRDQCLILATLDDDPGSRDAYVEIGREAHFVDRSAIVASGRR